MSTTPITTVLSTPDRERERRPVHEHTVSHSRGVRPRQPRRSRSGSRSLQPCRRTGHGGTSHPSATRRCRRSVSAPSDRPGSVPHAALRIAAPQRSARSGSAAMRASASLIAPSDSRRETLSVASGQVSQCVVGKGVPSSRIGGTSMTTGSPRWHRTSTVTGARTGRPICASTTEASSIGGCVTPGDEVPDPLEHAAVVPLDGGSLRRR